MMIHCAGGVVYMRVLYSVQNCCMTLYGIAMKNGEVPHVIHSGSGVKG